MVVAVAAGLTCASIPFPELNPASAKKRLPRTGRDRVLLVSVNLHETDYGDVTNHSDLKLFVRRMLKQVPRSPDVLLLQEVWGQSASQVAKILTRKTSDRYTVAVGAADPPWRQPKPTHVVGTDSAIVFNRRTMSVGRRGYMRLGYNLRKANPNRAVRVKRHPYAMLRERRGKLALPVTSVHFPKTDNFASREAAQKVKGRWMRRINRRLGRTFSSASARRSRVIAGDLNNPRCKRNKPMCSLTPAYRVATKKYRYTDAESALNGWTNPIDFIFSKAPVVKAAIDRTKNSRKKEYSDHVFRWALLERKDRTAPSPPGRISSAKGTRKHVRLRGWNKARDGGSGFHHFKIRKSLKGPRRGFKPIGRTRTREFKDKRVKAGQEYWYRVVALDKADNTSATSPVVHVWAGNPKRVTQRGPAFHHNGPRPKLDLRIERDAGEMWIDGPGLRTPHLDRPRWDSPSIPPIDGPDLDPPKPSPALAPPPIDP